MKNCWIATDVGGTFTDFIVYDEVTKKITTFKIPTTLQDQSEALMTGIKRIVLNSEKEDVRLRLIIHGTTTATNAMLQRKGAKVALLTTKGFEDVIEIGRQDRPRLYDLKVRRMPPLVPRNRRWGVLERINSQGEVEVELEDEELQRIEQWLRENEEDVESVAICFLFSFFNDLHEQKVKEFIERQRSKTLNFVKHVSISSRVHPEFREYERTVLTVLDAYVGPVMKRYLNKIIERFKELSLTVPLRIMQSNGGVASVQSVIQKPVTTLLSGLAGGVLAGLHSARELDLDRCITLDIGGTSTDVSVLYGHEPVVTREHYIGGHPLVLPSLDVETVGAGGGSIAWLYQGKILNVGPQSAEADPGPACYGKGGESPTVTDADVVLGYLNPQNFAGGEIVLEPQLAMQVIADLGLEMGLNVTETALGILRVFHANIAGAIKKVTLHRGHDPRKHSLIAFGGAGPTHGCFIAEVIGIKTVIVPPTPGTWSAYGLLTADFRHDKFKSIFRKLDEKNWDHVVRVRRKLEDELISVLMEENFSRNDIQLKCYLYCRYVGQSHELFVEHDQNQDAAFHAWRFHHQHRQKYGFDLKDRDILIVNVHVIAWGKTFTPTFPPLDAKTRQIVPRLKREVYWSSRMAILTPVYHREDLFSGCQLSGPLIIEQDDTTTLVPPGWKMVVHPSGHLILKKKGDDSDGTEK